MSVSTPLEIQRRTQLDAESTKLLRTFDLEWRCGTRLITLMLEAGYPPLAIGHALREVLGQYQRMCIERSNDFSRLRTVLSHVLNHLRKSDAALPNEQVLQWCTLSNVPSIVTEQLIHG
ncbi:hypothetical protein N5C93_27520 [Pseudomonas nitroreducens]|uniref:Uncharacterized protein n=1 Tax=Pseudomonas nitroreducens TaxID=46680 RepID=A0ABS0KN35_PSENT|nr:hypothetical protein [Pseudomonas nitroreducens]MBG6289446.1 hypothetical protein [Pseudomonas nitroreducens]MDG9857318.1 hypothetical protein [Pseudomonas nitroreducens]MDH1076588.1 hypothetical protein [Pseudomonas nitroreducens]